MNLKIGKKPKKTSGIQFLENTDFTICKKNDLRDGFYFYESQQRGLGTYFLDTLSPDIESLKLFAGIHRVHFEKYYRLLSKRFPFAVYYRINKDEVRIHAVVDCRRSPAWIRDRFV